MTHRKFRRDHERQFNSTGCGIQILQVYIHLKTMGIPTNRKKELFLKKGKERKRKRYSNRRAKTSAQIN